MNTQYKYVTTEELLEYQSMLLRNGYKINNFQLREEIPNIKVTPSSTAPRASIVVKNVKTTKEKTYPTGTGSPWLLQFEDDLKHHRFQ